jgi:hypothetical protein
MVPIRVQADLEFLERPTVGATLRHLWLTALFVVGLADLQVPQPAAVAGPTDPAVERSA